jgi:hypothetical protein
VSVPDYSNPDTKTDPLILTAATELGLNSGADVTSRLIASATRNLRQSLQYGFKEETGNFMKYRRNWKLYEVQKSLNG